MERWGIGYGHVFISRGDLTAFAGDAIVNAANTHLAGGGGVDGAIHRVAGAVELQQACQTIIHESGPLPTGEAVITPGFKLAARYIIHTVGPIWRGGKDNEPVQLRNAYRNSLKLAHQHGIDTIAFPAISCGVYGYPLHNAALVALSALKEGLKEGLVREAGMILHSSETYAIWQKTTKDVL